MISLSVLRLFAASDPHLFNHYLNQAGLQIVGKAASDPRHNSVRVETVLAVAAQVSSDIHDPFVFTPEQQRLQRLAESYGYAVALCEGIDQMPGSDSTPAHGFAKGSNDNWNSAFTAAQTKEPGTIESEGGLESESGDDEEGEEESPPPPA